VDYNEEKVDEATLALLSLVMWDDNSCTRAWKGFDWDTMNRLYQKGYIYDPKGKAKSVTLTEEGFKLSKELFEKLFAK
jgi:hypothetical protein